MVRCFNVDLLMAELGQGLTKVLQQAEDLQSKKPLNFEAAEGSLGSA